MYQSTVIRLGESEMFAGELIGFYADCNIEFRLA
jgi:hypothetical protein